MSTEGAIKAKLYRERNPERWNESLKTYWKKRYMCECGIEVCNKVRPQHKRSTRHKERMELIYQKDKERMELLDQMKKLSDKLKLYKVMADAHNICEEGIKFRKELLYEDLHKDHGFDILNKP